MFSFFKKNDGAVAVIVSLMLVPAILLSGTAVDIARIYSAKSIVEDANLLAGSTALAQYDALLKDTYGLFAMMEDDETTQALMAEYINVCLFGDGYKPSGIGTLEIFYNGSPVTVSVSEIQGHNLSNSEVMKRQIEEYMKFRAPVVIVEEVLDRLEIFTKVGEDSAIIEEKAKVDDGIGDVLEYYERIYTYICNADAFNIDVNVTEINSAISAFGGYLAGYKSAKSASESATADESASYALSAAEKNLDASLTGGALYEVKTEEETETTTTTNEDGEEVETTTTTVTYSVKATGTTIDGITGAIDKAQERFIQLKGFYEVIKSEAGLADQKKASTKIHLQSLSSKVSSTDEGSKEIKVGLTKSTDGSQSIMEEYDEILNAETYSMAVKYEEENKDYIDIIVGELEILRTMANKTHNSAMSQLEDLDGAEFSVEVEITKFADINHSDASDFYAKLVEMFGDVDTSGSQSAWSLIKAVKTAINSFLKSLADMLDLSNYTVEGAKHLDSAGSDFEPISFGGGDDADFKMSGFMNNGFLAGFAQLANDVFNKALLMTYSTEMFSNFTTNKNLEEGEKPDESLTGVPYSTEFNYFYQSELEYIFNGSDKSSALNIASVVGAVIMLRFVCNYIATFTISSITAELTTFSAAAGPLSLVLRELLRVCYALGESVLDVHSMIKGEQTHFFKSASTWRFSIKGITKEALSEVLEAAKEGVVVAAHDAVDSALLGSTTSSSNLPNIAGMVSSYTTSTTDKGEGNMMYMDYVRFLLLFKDSDEMAERIAKLIELNLTNHSESVASGNPDSVESAMTAVYKAGEHYDMSKATTGIQIETDTSVNLLFFNMDTFIKMSNEMAPSGSYPIKAKNYRGY